MPPRALAPRPPSTYLAKRDAAADLGRAELARESDSANTRRAHRSDVAAWQAYATAVGLPAFPISAEALAAYIGAMDRDGLAISTIKRRCSALARLHRERGADSPTDEPRVRKVLRGLVRTRGSAPKRKRAATAELVRAAMLARSCSARGRLRHGASPERAFGT